MKSSQVVNSNVFLSKQDTNDSSLKESINRARTNQFNEIKKFLLDGSQTLNLEFLKKRVTRKRSG